MRELGVAQTPTWHRAAAATAHHTILAVMTALQVDCHFYVPNQIWKFSQCLVFTVSFWCKCNEHYGRLGGQEVGFRNGLTTTWL